MNIKVLTGLGFGWLLFSENGKKITRLFGNKTEILARELKKNMFEEKEEAKEEAKEVPKGEVKKEEVVKEVVKVEKTT